MRFKKTEKNTSNKSTSSALGRSVIGLDIGQSGIRMVQLSGKGIGSIQLEKYAVVNLPHNVVSGNEIVDFDQLVTYLQQCYGQMKTNCKQVNIALPSASVTIETDLFYSADDGDLSLQEFVEAEVSRIGPLDEMSYDWQEFDASNGSKGKSVLMVAARTENVDRCSDLLDEVGLTAANIDVDLFALVNAFSYVDSIKDNGLGYARVAFFDIGDVALKAVILEGGKILYKQESQLGLEQLMQLVQRNYQTGDAEALAMIRGEASRPSDFKQLVNDDFNMQVAQEIQRVMQFFFAAQSSEQGGDVKHIFISGSGCMQGSGLAETVYAQTGVQVSQIAPVTLAQNKTKVDDLELSKDANSLTTAFGLALRGLFQ